jgi:uncharacterized protein YcbK (DUF882 family)
MTEHLVAPDRGRRSFALGALACAVGLPAWSQEAPERAADFWLQPRTVRLQHVSGERIVCTYWSDGQVVDSGYRELCWFMRDRVVQRAVYMSPVLLDIAYGVCGWLAHFGIRDPMVLTSGHRDRSRNDQIEGAVRNSLHITGEAMDVTIPGISTLQLARFALWLGGGGVGWYPRKDVTHLDRGRLRAWRG